MQSTIFFNALPILILHKVRIYDFDKHIFNIFLFVNFKKESDNLDAIYKHRFLSML